MKNLIILTQLVLLSFSALFVGCNEISEKNRNLDKTIEERSSIEVIPGFVMPDGTVTQQTASSLSFQLPPGYKFYGLNSVTGTAGEINNGGGTISCDCTTGGSCQPFETDDQVGCASDKSNPCEECIMRVENINGDDLDEYFIKTPPDKHTDLVYLVENRPILEYQEWRNTEFITSEMVNDETFTNHIEEVLQEAYPGQNPPYEAELLVSVPYLYEGKKLLLNVPYQSLSPGMIYTAIISDDGGTVASCSGCDNSCELKKASFGKVRYCVGNCQSSCSLSW